MSDTVALIHVHRVTPKALAKALDTVLLQWKYRRTESIPVPLKGPFELGDSLDRGVGHLTYLLGPERGNWTSIVQTFADRDDAPFLADVSNRLSQELATHSLAFLLHDSAVLYYNLDYRGTPRDGYCSNPQHSSEHHLTEPEILAQRHQPKAFTPLLPKHIKMEKLMDLLNAGWWHAHDTKQLDETNEPLDEHCLVDETDRLATLGGMLQLNGPAGYPFAHWRTTSLVDWKSWQAVYYQAKGRALPMA